MPAWGAVKRRDLIAGLRALGFKGPFSGGKHEFMVLCDAVVSSNAVYASVDRSHHLKTTPCVGPCGGQHALAFSYSLLD